MASLIRLLIIFAFPFHLHYTSVDFILIFLLGYTIQIDITPTADITMTTTASISLANSPTPLTFALSSELQGTGNLDLSGSLQGNWNDPFGFSWLTITDLSADLQFQEQELDDLTFEGELQFSWDQSSAEISLETADNLYDFSIEVQDVSIISFGNVISTVGQSVPSVVGDVNSLTNEVDIILSSYSYPIILFLLLR